MSGHSKWNNIKNRKGAEDAKRAKQFAQVAKLIKIAVKEGKSGDPKSNPSLRAALEKARAVNLPKDNIQKAIDRGLGKTAAGAHLAEVMYEGFGPGGVGILVASVTDNPNRTGGEVRFVFSRNAGSLAGPGSAAYLFERSDDGSYVPTLNIEVSEEDLSALQNLVDALLELEDVEEVFVATQLPEDEE